MIPTVSIALQAGRPAAAAGVPSVSIAPPAANATTAAPSPVRGPGPQNAAVQGINPFISELQNGDRGVGNHPVDAGNSAQLLVDTKQFVPAVMQDLKGAKSQINVTMFSWQDDGAGREIGDLLMRKAQAGVDVNVVIDAFGSRQWPLSRYKGYIDQMKEAGVHVVKNWRLNMPLVSDDNTGVRATDHRKIFEIDGKVAYLGGMNLAKKYDEWHDTMVRIEGPAAARAGAEVLGRSKDLGGKVTAANEETLAEGLRTNVNRGSAQVQIVGNSPKVELGASKEFFNLADKAKERFWVLTPFIGSNHEMIDKLVETAQRGVDVRLAVPGPNKWKNGKYALKLTRSYYSQLAAGGVKLYEQPQMSHSKLWLSDSTANISSVNIGDHSAKMDYEVGATINDPKFVGQVEALFHRDFDRSRAIPTTEANSYGMWEKVRKMLPVRI
ncbi:MAG: hypothetical protein H7123_02150 [Thermoleophilia bacterium]|nr:hypothetical protein [Thermoleophilia bacterium]